jgi:Uma2 family endonuclease
MQHDTHKGFREGRPRQEDPIRSAPTEPEAFLRWAAERPREDGKFELSRGRVVCNMIDASRPHGRVAKNIVGRLYNLLDPDRFDLNAADFAVQTPFGVRSPDVVVDNTSPHRDPSTSTPIFIAEVLSPSTENTDFTEQLEECTAIAALQTYLICSQDEPRAWLWARQGDGSWPAEPTELTGREGVIPLGGLGVELTMAATFRGIPDAPTVA